MKYRPWLEILSIYQNGSKQNNIELTFETIVCIFLCPISEKKELSFTKLKKVNSSHYLVRSRTPLYWSRGIV